ncbi:matrixin family metalloprotease [Psychrobacillus sp. FSL K6-2684]|uniref:matrixin family metalloprotease n=1 Tax=unclassified Psychrobacillus TaxID=2636677 RepID=UPI0012460ADD|nr:matrixin family metalloprotease [Psychrobacillus sp. AK 1817]QEY20650.1 hypothetical protein D0S48_08015 [Psychrobacillus sp. AK 1817]
MKKLTQRFLIVGALMLMILPASASAHFLGYSSVDGGEIRWGTYHGTTKWTTQRNAAISTWNTLSPINILGDTATTVEDVSFKDANRSDVTWAGLYSTYTGADLIQVNNYYLDNYSNAQRQNTFTHELGHALGLDHSYSTEIMHKSVTSKTTLGSHDKEDYHTLWGY